MAIELIVPLNQPYIITQLFGENVESYKHWTPRGHNGIDYAIPNGTPVMAAAAGKVGKVTSENGGYGNYVMVSHVDGKKTYHTYYAHLQNAAVVAGQTVQAGTVIGYSNNTGNSTGPHLHFSLKIDGADPYNLDYVDPMPYITGGTISPDYPDAVALPDLSLEVINVADVRKGPGTQYPTDGKLNPGATITGKRLRSDSVWVEFESGKWCALAHEGYVYLKVNSISETSQPSSGATDYPDAVPLPDILFDVVAGVLNVRIGPGTTYENPNQQQLHGGDNITGRRLHSKSVWIEFESGKWCALAHQGVVYLKTKAMTPPPPPPPPDFPDAVSIPSLAFEVLVGGDVRQGPGDQFTTNGKLDPGVTITGTRLHSNSVWIEFEPGKWYALAHGGKVYLKAKDVTIPGPVPVPPDPSAEFPNAVPLLGLSFKVLTTADVRQGPGTNYSTKGKLNPGATITGKRLQFQSIDIWIEFEQGRWYPFLLSDVFYLEVLGVKKLSPPTSVPTFSPDAVPLPTPLSFEVIRDKVSIRQTPDTDIAGIGQLQLGNKVTGGRLQIQPNGAWIEIKKGEWCPFVFKNINGKFVVALQSIAL